VSARAASGDADRLEVLERTGALRAGHFRLSSGKHSDVYVEKTRVFEHPEVVVDLGREIASWYERIHVVVSPAVGALPLGFSVALAAGARFVYAERFSGRMALLRGFALVPGEPTLVVEDVVTTGGSAAEVEELVRASGATSLGVAAMVDRSSGGLPFPLRSLARIEAQVFDPDACPLCDRDHPIESPGSRHR